MKKIEIPDTEKKRIIKLRDAGNNWSEIQEQTHIPRHACKRYYLTWQRESAARDKAAIRRSLAEEYLKDHIELQIDFASQLVELIHIPPPNVPEITPREQLSRLWNTNRWLQKPEEGVQPAVYPRKEWDENQPRQRLIQGQNRLVFESLQKHTSERVRWRALDEWIIGWNGCYEAVGKMRSRISKTLKKVMDGQGTLGQIWKSLGEQVIGKAEEEMVKMTWEVLVDSHVERDLVVSDDVKAAKAFAGYLAGDDTRELAIPSKYLGMVKSIGVDIIEILAQDLCGSDDIIKLIKNIELMSKAHQELEEKLNPLVLRPLILSTRCRLCPV